MHKNSDLSAHAKKMVNSCNKRDTVKGKAIIDMLRKCNQPISEAIINFQQKYGGLSCRFRRMPAGGSIYAKDFVLDLFYKIVFQTTPYINQYEGKCLVECIYYPSYPFCRGFMDEEGRIYSFIDGKYSIIADNIEMFLEGEAVKYHILSISNQWFTKSFYQSDFSNWLNDKELGLFEITDASSEYNKWWKTKDNTIFINYQYNGSEYKWGNAFTANADALKKLKSDGFSSYTIFPINLPYDFEKKHAVIDNPRELYYFNEKLYHTCDSSYINVMPVNEPGDAFLFLTGKNDFSVNQPIQQFLDKFPKFDLNNEVFDSDLVKYSIENNSGCILKIINYLSEMDSNTSLHSRTIAESNVYMLLVGEYFRRLIEFADSVHVKGVHPLYAYALEIPEVPETVSEELLFTQLNKMEHSYSKLFTMVCLKYMKLAQEGYETASKFYRVFEPVLLFFATGGYFLKAHGYLEIGRYAVPFNNWRNKSGKISIDIYKEMPKAWASRNFNYALNRIDRIKWSEDGVLPKLREPLLSERKGIGKLQSFFYNLATAESVDNPSFLYSARKLGENPLSNITDLCPNLIEVEDTLIRCICESYLEWSILLDKGNREATKNPCLYEPFIELYIEGGNLTELYRNTLILIEAMESKPINSYSEFLISEGW
jgi:hypothetical protein